MLASPITGIPGGFKAVSIFYTRDIYTRGRDANDHIIQWPSNASPELVISESQKYTELGFPLTGLNSIDGGCISELLGSSFAACDTILSLEFHVSSSILCFKG